jgi:hypothetical protein
VRRRDGIDLHDAMAVKQFDGRSEKLMPLLRWKSPKGSWSDRHDDARRSRSVRQFARL